MSVIEFPTGGLTPIDIRVVKVVSAALGWEAPVQVAMRISGVLFFTLFGAPNLIAQILRRFKARSGRFRGVFRATEQTWYQIRILPGASLRTRKGFDGGRFGSTASILCSADLKIGRMMGRSASTISRELAGQADYGRPQLNPAKPEPTRRVRHGFVWAVGF